MGNPENLNLSAGNKDPKKVNTPRIQYTSNEVLSNLNEKDLTLEICLYVSKTNRLMKYSAGKQKYEFLLTNNSRKPIQAVAWGSRAKDMAKLITETGMILFLERPKAKELSFPNNKGAYKHELRIDDGTRVTVMGLHMEQNQPSTPLQVFLKDVNQSAVSYEIKAYIKSPLSKIVINSVPQMIGSITDGKKKLEIRVKKHEEENLELKKGVPVVVIGKLYIPVNGCPILYVEKIEDIKKIDGPNLPFYDILRGFECIV